MSGIKIKSDSLRLRYGELLGLDYVRTEEWSCWDYNKSGIEVRSHSLRLWCGAVKIRICQKLR